jgi:hypothetical protein
MTIKDDRLKEWKAMASNPTIDDAFLAGWKYAIDQALLMMKEKESKWRPDNLDLAFGANVLQIKIGSEL